MFFLSLNGFHDEWGLIFLNIFGFKIKIFAKYVKFIIMNYQII